VVSFLISKRREPDGMLTTTRRLLFAHQAAADRDTVEMKQLPGRFFRRHQAVWSLLFTFRVVKQQRRTIDALSRGIFERSIEATSLIRLAPVRPEMRP